MLPQHEPPRIEFVESGPVGVKFNCWVRHTDIVLFADVAGTFEDVMMLEMQAFMFRRVDAAAKLEMERAVNDVVHDADWSNRMVYR